MHTLRKYYTHAPDKTQPTVWFADYTRENHPVEIKLLPLYRRERGSSSPILYISDASNTKQKRERKRSLFRATQDSNLRPTGS